MCNKIIYAFGSKGLDPMKLEEEGEWVFILDHAFYPVENCINKVYMCDDCSCYIKISPYGGKYILYIFKEQRDALAYANNEIKFSTQLCYKRMMSCDEFAILDILE